jgi:predicted sulfurtransferase
MKKLILFVAVAFAACNSVHSNGNSSTNTPTTPTPVARQVTNDSIPRISTADLEDLMKQGKVVVVDVRNKDMYDRGHIRGAKLIPLNEVGERTKELPRDKKIVTYCS